MGTKSKFFRAFVAGSTISDGRTITDEMIDQIVETFNVDTYTPRINIEHISGYSPEPPFNGYGDVIAVKAQVDDIVIAGKTEKRKALYAQIDANAQLVKLFKDEQKPFPSVELTPSYTGTEKIGLVGMAFTDKPASIATQKPQFSRSAPGTLFATSGEAVAVEFDAALPDDASIASQIKAGFASVAAMFSRTEPEKQKEEPKPANDNDFAAFATALGDTFSLQVAAALAPITAAQTQFRKDFDALTAKLETTEQPNFTRPLAPGGGGNNQHLTDC